MSPDVFAAGVFGIVGAVLGSLVGLFGERLVRGFGKVQCEIKWWVKDSHERQLERQLEIRFLNRKDMPVNVWDMRVLFYKGGMPIPDEKSPYVTVVDGNDRYSRNSVDILSLPAHLPVTRTISVTTSTYLATGGNIVDYRPGKEEAEMQRARAVEEADRVEFHAIMVGTKDIRMQLALWNDSTPQTKRNY